MPDLLEQWRRKAPQQEMPPAAQRIIEDRSRGVAAAQVEPVSKDDAVYEPYRTSAHPRPMFWLRVNPSNKSSDMYASFGHMPGGFYDGNGLLIQVMIPGFASIRIHGRNLEDLLRKLMLHEVEWIWEYDPRRWPKAPGENEPCITAIDIRLTSSTEKDGKDETKH